MHTPAHRERSTNESAAGRSNVTRNFTGVFVMTQILDNDLRRQLESQQQPERAEKQSNTTLGSLRLGGSLKRGSDAGERTSLAEEPQAGAPSSSPPAFMVTHIKDAASNWMLVAPRDASTSPSVSSFGYAFTPSSAGINHAIVDLAPLTTYYVAATGSAQQNIAVSKTNNGGFQVATDEAGVLAFRTGSTGVGPPSAPYRVIVR